MVDSNAFIWNLKLCKESPKVINKFFKKRKSRKLVKSPACAFLNKHLGGVSVFLFRVSSTPEKNWAGRLANSSLRKI